MEKHKFLKVIETIHDNYYKANELYIVTAQLSSKKHYIKAYLDKFCPNMFKDNNIICKNTPIKGKTYNDKVNKLEVLRINEFYEDSCNNINAVWSAKQKLPDLTHLYICNPFDEERPFESVSILRPSGIKIPPRGFLNVIGLSNTPCN